MYSNSTTSRVLAAVLAVTHRPVQGSNSHVHRHHEGRTRTALDADHQTLSYGFWAINSRRDFQQAVRAMIVDSLKEAARAGIGVGRHNTGVPVSAGDRRVGLTEADRGRTPKHVIMVYRDRLMDSWVRPLGF
jgi:hypothetical protein